MKHTIEIKVYEIKREELMEIEDSKIYDYEFKYQIIKGLESIGEYNIEDIDQAIRLILIERNSLEEFEASLDLEVCLVLDEYTILKDKLELNPNILDSINLEIKNPDDKIMHYKSEIDSILEKRKTQKNKDKFKNLVKELKKWENIKKSLDIS